MAKMRAVRVTRARGPLETVEREIPVPGPGSVRVRVEACGICHSDTLTKEGSWPGIEYPRVPGHEIAGVVDAVGDGRRPSGRRATASEWDGTAGTADTAISAGAETSLAAASASGSRESLTTAGTRTTSSLPPGARADSRRALAGRSRAADVRRSHDLQRASRHSGALAGDLVAVLGLGGLGHLGVQFASKMGFDTVAIARGADKEPLAKQLGARFYIDSRDQDAAAELTKLGGARVILATVTSGTAMSALIGGLGPDGKLLVVVGLRADPLQVPAGLLIGGRRSVAGWPSGRSIDSEDTMEFAARTGVRSMNEIFPLERTAEAYDRMMSGEARFRVVLTT